MTHIMTCADELFCRHGHADSLCCLYVSLIAAFILQISLEARNSSHVAQHLYCASRWRSQSCMESVMHGAKWLAQSHTGAEAEYVYIRKICCFMHCIATATQQWLADMTCLSLHRMSGAEQVQC